MEGVVLHVFVGALNKIMGQGALELGEGRGVRHQVNPVQGT